MKVYHMAAAGVLIVGVAGHIKDYKDWKYEETHRYGYGWAADQELAAAQKLAGPYQNNLAKIRLRYPRDWDVAENSKVKTQKSNDEVVTFTSPFTLNSEGKRSSITVAVGPAKKNLPDVVHEEADKIGNLAREWEYINGERMGFTVITWETGEWTNQKAMGVKGGRLVVIDVACEQAMWKSLAKTFEQVYRSVVLF